MADDRSRRRTVYTHCQICEQLCGVAVTVEEGRIVSIRPDKQNPYSWQDFCVKARRANDVVTSPWRIRSPMKRLGDRWVPSSYDEAVGDIAGRLRGIIDRHGPDAVAGYLGNPMGFSFGATIYHSAFLAAIGTHQRFGVQSIDSNAKHVACDAMFGLETLALLPDIDATDCALLIGTNPAISKFNWGGKVPDGWRRLKARVRAGADLIVVDPRRTETAVHATCHLAPVPETDWALLVGMVKVILAEGAHRLPPGVPVVGLDVLGQIANDTPLDRLAAICDVPEGDIAAVARRFAAAKRAFAFAGTGPALGRHGVLTHWLTLALNVLTDRLEREGGRFTPNWPFNTAIAQARRPTEPRVRSRVRGLEPVVGQHSLGELADEIMTPGDGQIRALFICGGNPVSTGAGGHRLAQALRQLDLLVSVDLFQRESHRDAHWLIPAVHFIERDDTHVYLHAYNDRPFIQSSRPVVSPPDRVRPEWTFYRDLAAAIGKDLSGLGSPDDVAAKLLESGGTITLDDVRSQEHGLLYGERTMGHLWEFFRTERRAIDVCPDRFAQHLRIAIGDDTVGMPATGQFRIISRRRDGMMNASLTETTGSMVDDETADTVEIHHRDAVQAGIEAGDRVEIRSETATITAKALVSDDIRRGTVVLAQGWGSPLYEPSSSSEVFRRGNERNKLVSDADLDPLSAAPRLNGTLVSVTPIRSSTGSAAPG